MAGAAAGQGTGRQIEVGVNTLGITSEAVTTDRLSVEALPEASARARRRLPTTILQATLVTVAVTAEATRTVTATAVIAMILPIAAVAEGGSAVVAPAAAEAGAEAVAVARKKPKNPPLQEVPTQRTEAVSANTAGTVGTVIIVVRAVGAARRKRQCLPLRRHIAPVTEVVTIGNRVFCEPMLALVAATPSQKLSS